MNTLLKLGDGSLINGLLIFLLAVSGLILAIRGAIANIEKMAEKMEAKRMTKNWQIGTHFLFIILSYLALVYAIKQLL